MKVNVHRVVCTCDRSKKEVEKKRVLNTNSSLGVPKVVVVAYISLQVA